MPQMAPLLWLILYFYFIMIFYMVIVNIYFTCLPSKKNCPKNNREPNSFNWKW